MSLRIPWWLVALGLVIALAIFFRFYDLKHYPPGLFPDEAANGEDVLLMFQGDIRPFYARGNGREALFFYLQAAMVYLFGIEVWPMHAAAAIVGTLTVAAMYWAGRVWFGQLAGVLAALLLATNHWHVTLSRTGFRAIMIPLIIATFTALVGAVVESVRQKKWWRSYIYAALAGVVFSAGFYTYIAYRVMIGVVAGMFVIWLVASLHPKIGWPHLVRYGRQIVIGALTAVLTILPLAWYFVAHPEAIVGRAGQVSVFNPDLQQPGGVIPTVLWSLRHTLESFFVGTGDLNWRHNVAGYPLLNPLVGLLFLFGTVMVMIGVGRVVSSIIRGKELHLSLIFPYLVLLFSGLLLPVITTAEGIPHGLRSVGLIVPIFLTAALAAAVIGHWLVARARWLRTMAVGAAVGVLLLAATYDGILYFVVARHDAQAAAAYRGDLTEVANYLKDYARRLPSAPAPYVVLDAFSEQTIHYLTHERHGETIVPAAHDFESHPDREAHRYRLVEPHFSSEIQLQPGEIILFTQSTLADADRYAAQTPANFHLLESRHNAFGEEVLRIYGAGKATNESDSDASLDA